MIKTNTVIKHDLSANWSKAKNFVPKKEEVIIYDDIFPCGIKIGDGVTNLQDLPFVSNYEIAVEQDTLTIN